MAEGYPPESPPGRRGPSGSGLVITTAQAVALLTDRVSFPLTVKRVEQMLSDLGEAGRLVEPDGLAWEVTPDMVDMLEGVLRQHAAGWWLTSRTKPKDGHEAVVVWPDGHRTIYRLSVQWSAGSSRVSGPGLGELPDRVALVEWPTGRVTGALVRREGEAGVEGGKAVYDLVAIENPDGRIGGKGDEPAIGDGAEDQERDR